MTKHAIVMMALLAASRAVAADGVLEINQTCALQTGCFPGDPAGFPVTVTNAGSYRLTGNLVATDTSLDVIQISASDVTLDLGGFEIRGPVICLGTPISCSPFIQSTGIMNMGFSGLDVRNGSIVGMRVAIGRIINTCCAESRVSNLRIKESLRGIEAGDHSMIVDNIIVRTGDQAISAGRGALIRGNVVSRNKGAIFASLLSHITDNQVDLNEVNQITAGDSSSVHGNTIGAAWLGGQTLGIECGVGCSVFDNLIRNSVRPVFLGAGSRYGRNVMTLSSFPPFGGTSAGDNQCDVASC